VHSFSVIRYVFFVCTSLVHNSSNYISFRCHLHAACKSFYNESMRSLDENLQEMTVDGALMEPQSDGKVRCLACAHQCLLAEGKAGICRVRFNRGGKLRVPWGYTAGIAVDPIEKKPFAHFLPGSGVLTIGMAGCNFHCQFCQNWLSAQVLRDDAVTAYPGMIRRAEPKQIVELALDAGASAIASSYNEPIISAEWAYDIFLLARKHGLKTVMVSNGFASRAALEFLRPVMDGYKIDLKSMNPERYHEMGGRLEPVLESIQTAHDLGLWVEVVTLVIPGWNDGPQEL
jgi:pyruvate formate lyase activating enzyme